MLKFRLMHAQPYLMALVAWFLSPQLTYGQITFHVANFPSNTPTNASLYFAGNINSWNPGDSSFRFAKVADGYWLTVPVGNGSIEYKITRGDWTTVEGNEAGAYRPNRKYTYGNGDTVQLTVLSWEDLGGGASSTANKQVFLWQSKLYVPQLNRYKKIWVYLPQNYDSVKKFPVLYMHDGQNVFDNATSVAGEWKVDETLVDMENRGLSTAIVVAIENGGVERINEYSPFVNAQYGGGDGDAYLDFIIQTVKPMVDSVFYTLKDAPNTGIMGSSMGGLISHYGHFRNPEIFGKAGICSPAYWFSDSFERHTLLVGKTNDSKLYLLAGGGEVQIAQGTNAMHTTLTNLGFTNNALKTSVVSDGAHSEWFWAREFEDVFKWLFHSSSSSILPVSNTSGVQCYPNPTSNILNIEVAGEMEVKIYDTTGRLSMASHFTNRAQIDLKSIQSGGEIRVFLVHVVHLGGHSIFKVLAQ